MIQSDQHIKEPFIIISLLNWNNYEDTILCVQSLRKLQYTNYQIIIRDNASLNDSYDQLKNSLPELIIHRSEVNNGYADGHFQNYLEARKINADLFWILNSDLEVDTFALTELVIAYKKNKKAIYGSVSLIPGEERLIDFGGAEMSSNSNKTLTYNSWKNRSYKELRLKHGDLYEVESVEGSSMLIPMAVIEEFGFLYTDFFMYGEEIEYCYRLRKRNINSYISTLSIIKHQNEGSLKSAKNLKIIPMYYRKRNIIRLKKELFNFSLYKIYQEGDSFFILVKSIVKGLFTRKKSDSYYYSLAQIHGICGIKGKIIEPEKLIKK